MCMTESDGRTKELLNRDAQSPNSHATPAKHKMSIQGGFMEMEVSHTCPPNEKGLHNECYIDCNRENIKFKRYDSVIAAVVCKYKITSFPVKVADDTQVRPKS